MTKEFKFSSSQKLTFWIKTFFYFLLILKDVKKGKFKLLSAEIFWLASRFHGKQVLFPKKITGSYFVTKFGKFKIEPRLSDLIIVSPVFERLDIENLISIIRKELDNQKSVLFIDIGAYFGTYSISIGNQFKKRRNLQVCSFEPNSIDISLKSFSLLKENAKLNDLKNVKLFNIGLGSINSEKVNKHGFKTKKMDSVLDQKIAKKYDVIFIKIDIEGAEVPALQGASEFIHNSKRFFLLVEDFIEPNEETLKYLKKNFEFLDKLTPYNSLWTKK